MARIILAVVTLLLVSACNRVIYRPDMEQVAGRSPGFQRGYKEGCNSGYVAGGYVAASFKRDTHLYMSDDEYRAGWKHGYKQCEREYREREGLIPWLDKSDANTDDR